MRYAPSEIQHAFKGRLVGGNFMKNMVSQTLAKFPNEIVEHIIKHVWFLSSHPDAWAYTFAGSDVPDKHLIFLSDELLSQDKSQIEYTIAHEIGHVILKHKNSINYESPDGASYYRNRQTKEEISQQEWEADQFARKHLIS